MEHIYILITGLASFLGCLAAAFIALEGFYHVGRLTRRVARLPLEHFGRGGLMALGMGICTLIAGLLGLFFIIGLEILSNFGEMK